MAPGTTRLAKGAAEPSKPRWPGGIPQPIAVTSDDLEMVVAGRHVTVKCCPPGIRLQPIRVQSLKPITEAHPLRAEKLRRYSETPDGVCPARSESPEKPPLAPKAAKPQSTGGSFALLPGFSLSSTGTPSIITSSNITPAGGVGFLRAWIGHCDAFQRGKPKQPGFCFKTCGEKPPVHSSDNIPSARPYTCG